MCTNGARRHYPNIPTRDDVSQHLVHEYLQSDDIHEYVWFREHSTHGSNQFYGVERSMSVLEDWYARNTNGEDAILD
jgi:hypothetical protein